ncbi:ATP-binding cassette domain-containing protein, partial [Methylobacterium tarhaniae]|uniref:ATP-binding cassette domain-containing protein n=1 Tax=Methylobacterium tarhaniae TaxID=1187852 RepID=UPI003D03A3E0
MERVNKWYGAFHVLRDVDLSVRKGERIVICGPSGSGKSTLIRCINRLEEHQAGRIVVDGIELTNDLKRIDEIRREVGMVFQHFNHRRLEAVGHLAQARLAAEEQRKAGMRQ